MQKKLRVAVIYGGKSGEHEVSLISAASVMKAMDLEKYEVLPIGITKEGEWQVGTQSFPALEGSLGAEKLDQLQSQLPSVSNVTNGKQLPALTSEFVDVVFPVLHGTYGEDGTIQGMFEMANVPYVGAGVLASAVAMDKVMAKMVCASAGLPQGEFVHYLRAHFFNQKEEVLDDVEEKLGYPCFVKPANLGSSVGISKANHRSELEQAMDLAYRYDRKVLVEEFIPAREIEVAVLGNDDPQASLPGEIISSSDFYDYQAKYVDGKSAMEVPAKLTQEQTKQVREMAIKSYQALDCTGLARVDFFLRKDNEKILINEVNTLPGFTPFSMYPVMWKETGLPYSELIDRLIRLAIERYDEKQSLITSLES
ncbi:D-alanine-D-alanine ligase [Thermoactinomyces sp. DSM 45891]|uniref:D-alanine--D-alanine ligase n=1 Tax=Thermoactinomyces sp. DSM 45891 TaxID=1761907 RepID=UPI000913C0A2|nr:D-alanine--D-alanine ligase [Thermoactinomyces sp. DSM 45891]SFX11439.1 D-alanine-D-alanine ligase [Thermoactinomyces sp. DSM 45891]